MASNSPPANPAKQARSTGRPNPHRPPSPRRLHHRSLASHQTLRAQALIPTPAGSSAAASSTARSPASSTTSASRSSAHASPPVSESPRPSSPRPPVRQTASGITSRLLATENPATSHSGSTASRSTPPPAAPNPLTTPEQLSNRAHAPSAIGTFQGALDEIRIWDRVLTQREVLDLAIEGGALPTARLNLFAQRLGQAEADRLDAAIESTRPTQTTDPPNGRGSQRTGTRQPTPSFVRIRGMAGVPGAPVSLGVPRILAGTGHDLDPPARRRRVLRPPPRSRSTGSPIQRTQEPLASSPIASGSTTSPAASSAHPTNTANFGEEPTHPELLDWLAAELVEGDWQLKRMHKLIMMSSAYRMSSCCKPGTRHRSRPHQQPLHALQSSPTRRRRDPRFDPHGQRHAQPRNGWPRHLSPNARGSPLHRLTPRRGMGQIR